MIVKKRNRDAGGGSDDKIGGKGTELEKAHFRGWGKIKEKRSHTRRLKVSRFKIYREGHKEKQLAVHGAEP